LQIKRGYDTNTKYVHTTISNPNFVTTTETEKELLFPTSHFVSKYTSRQQKSVFFWKFTFEVHAGWVKKLPNTNYSNWLLLSGANALKIQTPRHHCVRLPNLNSPPFNLAGVADIFCKVVAQILWTRIHYNMLVLYWLISWRRVE
jgi:hypothetical protein